MFASLQLTMIEADKIQNNEFLSRVADELRDLGDQRQQLIVQLKELLADPHKKQSVIQMIREYEMQWGKFAGGVISQADFASLNDLINYCLSLKQLLQALS